MCGRVLRQEHALACYRVIDLVCAQDGRKRSGEVGDCACQTHVVSFLGNVLQTKGLLDSFLSRSITSLVEFAFLTYNIGLHTRHHINILLGSLDALFLEDWVDRTCRGHGLWRGLKLLVCIPIFGLPLLLCDVPAGNCGVNRRYSCQLGHLWPS
jgi:hypothetical protein